MADFGILLQYADRVRSRLIAQQKTFAMNLAEALQLWAKLPQSQLPLASYQVPVELQKAKPYTIVAADSSPLELSRHRAVELKAVSLSRVYTDYHLGEENIERKIVDFAQDDVASLSNPLLELECAVIGKKADLVLVDGSLIRWQWEQLTQVKREELVGKYVQLLSDSSQRGAPVLAVIDRSQGRDVIETLERLSGASFSGIVDEDLFREVLVPGSFSQVFVADSPILKLDHRYQVGFVYYKVQSKEQKAKSKISSDAESELVISNSELVIPSLDGVLRVEFLLGQEVKGEAWECFVDQVEKGRGYPFVIARAHDTCVVKNKDKRMLELTLMKYGRMSQKERMKRLG